jgi:hypothetical protein
MKLFPAPTFRPAQPAAAGVAAPHASWRPLCGLGQLVLDPGHMMYVDGHPWLPPSPKVQPLDCAMFEVDEAGDHYRLVGAGIINIYRGGMNNPADSGTGGNVSGEPWQAYRLRPFTLAGTGLSRI